MSVSASLAFATSFEWTSSPHFIEGIQGCQSHARGCPDKYRLASKNDCSVVGGKVSFMSESETLLKP